MFLINAHYFTQGADGLPVHLKGRNDNRLYRYNLFLHTFINYHKSATLQGRNDGQCGWHCHYVWKHLHDGHKHHAKEGTIKPLVKITN